MMALARDARASDARGRVVARSSVRTAAICLSRYATTIPRPARIELLGRILYHVADQLPELPLLFDAEPTVFSNRLLHLTAQWPASARTSTQAWNARQWNITPGL
jgi:hypothetical protein